MKRVMRSLLALAIVPFASGCGDPGVQGGGSSGGGGPSGGGPVFGQPGAWQGGGSASGLAIGGGSAGGTTTGSPTNPANPFGGVTFRDGGTVTGGPNVDEKNCGIQKFSLEKLPPEILLVLDRSGSMQEPVAAFPGSGPMPTRWSAVVSALDVAIKQTEGGVHWGLKFYPTPPKHSLLPMWPDPSMADACNVTMGPVEVTVGVSHYMPISKFINGIPFVSPSDGRSATPTHLAIDSATVYLKTVTTKNPKYVLLATDGIPNCAPNPVPQDSVTAITAAANAGFHTFVIGVNTSQPKAIPILDAMAVAGLEPRMGMPKFYGVETRDELVNAMLMIASRASNCIFPLSMPPPSPQFVAVDVGGMRLPRDTNHTSGWDYRDSMNKAIEVYGPICDQLRDGKIANVNIVFGCSVKDIQ